MSDHPKSTLIAASLLTAAEARSMLREDTSLELLPDGPAGPARFKIKSAESPTRRSLIGGLLRTRYSWRGYQAVELAAYQSRQSFTLVALDEVTDQPLGTITVAFDMGKPLSADDAFREELQALRARGEKLCEFTKLAIDPTTATKRVLAALFHVAYIVAHRVRGYDRLVIEVNPRHQRYYERMLGLEVAGGERMNRTVKAPAVLLTASFQHIREQIDLYGGRPDLAARTRTLYTFAFSQTEEESILARLRSIQERRSRPRD